MHLSSIRFASVAFLIALAAAAGAAVPALGCDDDSTQVFSAPAMELAYGGACGGVPQQAVVVQQAPVVYRQAAPVVVQQAPAVVYRQAAPVVYGGSSGFVGRGVGFAPGVAGGGGISAGRNVRIRKSTVSGIGSGGVISAGRNVKIRKSNVGF